MYLTSLRPGTHKQLALSTQNKTTSQQCFIYSAHVSQLCSLTGRPSLVAVFVHVLGSKVQVLFTGHTRQESQCLIMNENQMHQQC